MHNIQIRDVQVGIEMAWHKLTKVEQKIDKSNAQILYPMTINPLYFIGADGNYHEGNGRQIISLDDGGPIGRPVGEDYKLIGNREIWESVEQGLAGTKHEIVSCGTVNDRSLGFISVKISDQFKAANRDTNSVMNILWGHGGNRAVIARTGFTVVVCQNTFNMAMKDKGDFKLSIRHTAKANVLDLGKAIDAHIGVVAEFKNAMDEFHSVDVKTDDARKIFAGFIAGDEIPETKTGISRFTNTLDKVQNLFLVGKGNGGRTLADVFNGVTDFYSHESSGGDSRWKQFVSSEFGAGDVKKSEFFDILSNRNNTESVKRQGELVLSALGI
jgi:hypothetical protein